MSLSPDNSRFVKSPEVATQDELFDIFFSGSAYALRGSLVRRHNEFLQSSAFYYCNIVSEDVLQQAGCTVRQISFIAGPFEEDGTTSIGDGNMELEVRTHAESFMIQGEQAYAGDEETCVVLAYEGDRVDIAYDDTEIRAQIPGSGWTVDYGDPLDVTQVRLVLQKLI